MCESIVNTNPDVGGDVGADKYEIVFFAPTGALIVMICYYRDLADRDVFHFHFFM